MDSNEQANELIYETKGQDVYIKPKSNKHTETIVFMHGLGDTAMGWFDTFFDIEASPVLSTTKVVLLTAPSLKVTINGGMKMPAWFDMKTLEMKKDAKLDDMIGVNDVIENSKRISEVIEKEIEELNGNSKRVFIGGFSQGCCMAMFTGLNFKKRLGGILCYSGFLLPNAEFSDENLKTPLFISHGKDDPILNFKMATVFNQRMKSDERNKDREYTEIYPSSLGHSINYTILNESRKWFNKILDSTK